MRGVRTLATSVALWRNRDATGDTVAPRGYRRRALCDAMDFILTPAPAWEVKFAMGLLRHGKVPPPLSHPRQGVRFAAAATLSQ